MGISLPDFFILNWKGTRSNKQGISKSKQIPSMARDSATITKKKTYVCMCVCCVLIIQMLTTKYPTSLNLFVGLAVAHLLLLRWKKNQKTTHNQSDPHRYMYFFTFFNNGYFQIPPKVLFLLSCLKGLLFPEKLLLLPLETELI